MWNAAQEVLHRCSGRKRERALVALQNGECISCLSEVEVLSLLVSPYAATLLLGAIALLRSYIALLLDITYSQILYVAHIR